MSGCDCLCCKVYGPSAHGIDRVARRTGKTMAEVLRDAAALERFYDENRKDTITIETRDGGVREVKPR
jgi:hypothetical protein